MAYGTVKADSITFTSNSADVTTTLSGIYASTTNNLTLTGTASAVTFTGTTANFVSGVFSTQVSGVKITGTTVATTTGTFTSLTGTTATFTSGIIASGTAALPSLAILSDPNTGIFSPGADQLAVATNGTEKLIVLSNGNVGIGTSSPSGLLHVQSNLAGNNQIILTNIASSNSGAGSEIVFTQGASGHAAGKIQCDREGAYSATVSTHDSALAFFTAADGVDTERLRITSAGLVGIGTTSPDALLTVNGIGAFGAGAVGTPSISATGDLNTGFWFPAADTIAASTTGSERLRIDSSGRLLVGTSTVPTFRITNDDRTDSTHITTKSGTALGASFAVVQWAGNTAGAWGNDVVFAKSFNGTVGTHTIGSSGSLVSRLFFSASDGTRFVPAASIETFIDGTPGTNDMPGRLVFSTTADGASSPTERLRITSAGVLQIADASDITVGTTTGTKIGTATTQKLGFYNATPVVQPAAVADATDAATVITQLNDLLAKLRTLGIIAT